MGLGLLVVKRTVFDHRGRVDVDSGPHGTQVSVMLPVERTGADGDLDTAQLVERVVRKF